MPFGPGLIPRGNAAQGGTQPRVFLRAGESQTVVGTLVPVGGTPLVGFNERTLAMTQDAIMAGVYGPNEPGAVLLVQKDGRVLVRKAYGMANLELGVALEPDMVFRIGSMTKPFTAVAVLMLMEQGRLGPSDPITRFLPDYPTRGRTITVEHLLSHTSGIPSFTSLPGWLPLMRKDMTLTELIDLFRKSAVRLGPRVLRTETAALAALAAMQALWGDFRGR